MPHDAESEKHAQIERVLQCRAGVGDGPDERFIREFYRNVAAEDLLSRTAQNLFAAASSIWSFLGERRPGRARIRVIDAPSWAPGRCFSSRSFTSR